jgi:hypothetical protein
MRALTTIVATTVATLTLTTAATAGVQRLAGGDDRAAGTLSQTERPTNAVVLTTAQFKALLGADDTADAERRESLRSQQGRHDRHDDERAAAHARERASTRTTAASRGEAAAHVHSAACSHAADALEDHDGAAHDDGHSGTDDAAHH